MKDIHLFIPCSVTKKVIIIIISLETFTAGKKPFTKFFLNTGLALRTSGGFDLHQMVSQLSQQPIQIPFDARLPLENSLATVATYSTNNAMLCFNLAIFLPLSITMNPLRISLFQTRSRNLDLHCSLSNFGPSNKTSLSYYMSVTYAITGKKFKVNHWILLG